MTQSDILYYFAVMDKEKISERLQAEVADFFEYTQITRLNRNLRNLLVAYSITVKGDHMFNMHDLLFDLSSLFALLDVAEDEL